MFDIGFWELSLIGVVALLVIGPNRLPEVARTAGRYVGKVRRFISSVQRDIDREISKAEELNRLLEQQKKIVERHEIIEELNSSIPVGGAGSSKSSAASDDSAQSSTNDNGKKE